MAKLQDYFGAIGQWAVDQFAEDSRDNEAAWSAAFISYVVKNAGVTPSHGFSPSIRHMTYIVEALVNRKNRDLDRPFWLYKAEDLSPQVGDILCKPWNETPCANLTLAGLESQFIEKKASGEYAIKGTPTGHSHTDVVVRRFSDDGTDYIETLGGNTRDLSGVAHTVGRRRWRLNANGRVDACVDRNNEVIEDCPPFAFIRIVHPTTQQLLDAAADEGGVSV